MMNFTEKNADCPAAQAETAGRKTPEERNKPNQTNVFLQKTQPLSPHFLRHSKLMFIKLTNIKTYKTFLQCVQQQSVIWFTGLLYLLFITQPPKPDSLVSMPVKTVLLALPSHLASAEGDEERKSACKAGLRLIMRDLSLWW